MAANASTPLGCGAGLDPLYHRLCDRDAAWGIVLEALASVGVVFCLVLLLSLLASLPFVPERNRRSSVALHAFLLLFTLGLFGLTFAFIVGRDFATCATRRFLFGILFAGCFSCLLMQGVRLNFLSRTNAGPPVWVLLLGALGLWSVEVLINVEWLIITMVRHPTTPPPAPPNTTVDRAAATPCNIANQDFVAALVYVMVLMVAVVVAGATIMAGRYKQWWSEGGCIFTCGVLSVGIWTAWIVMYVYGNDKHGAPTWHDPTLAMALVANAWTFLLVYTIPQICCLTAADPSPTQNFGEDLYASHAAGYENILKEQHAGQSVFMDNKAFSLDEANAGVKPVSPYSGYSGQLRTSVYQPTELALITHTGSLGPDSALEVVIPRASVVSTATAADSGSSAASTLNGTLTNGKTQRAAQW